MVGEIGLMLIEVFESESREATKTAPALAFVVLWVLGDMLAIAAWRHKSLAAQSGCSCYGAIGKLCAPKFNNNHPASWKRRL